MRYAERKNLRTLNLNSVSTSEIHAGTNECFGTAENAFQPLIFSSGEREGYVDEQVFGAYLRGIFDSSSAASQILKWTGSKSVETTGWAQEREK